MAINMNFSKICRICLSDGVPMDSLFSVCSPEVINFCTSVEVSETDQLPKKVCENCSEMMNKVYVFKKLAIKSDGILKQQLATQGTGSNVKEEGQQLDLGFEHVFTQNSQEQSQSENEDLKPRKKRKYTKAATDKKPKGNRMKCVKCEKSFQKYENLEAHMRSHFGLKPDIKCDQCDKSFLNFRTLNAHLRSMHKGEGRKYQCQTCGKHFNYLNVLKNHELIHSGIKKHACHICDMKFVQPYNLKMHLETHSSVKNYGCVQCGKRFAQAGNLKIHLIRHSGVKNIACTVCDMKFYVKSDLYKHMRSHSENKPFACTLCDKQFKSKSFHTVHMRTHTGERPFACDICPKRFMATKDLRNHRMIHTGEKPHKCTLCNQAFIQKCALNRHMKGHNKIAEDSMRSIQASQARVLQAAPPPPLRNPLQIQESQISLFSAWPTDA